MIRRLSRSRNRGGGGGCQAGRGRGVHPKNNAPNDAYRTPSRVLESSVGEPGCNHTQHRELI
eukprot:765473-Hanusia_phi.AAC.3